MYTMLFKNLYNFINKELSLLSKSLYYQYIYEPRANLLNYLDSLFF